MQLALSRYSYCFPLVGVVSGLWYLHQQPHLDGADAYLAPLLCGFAIACWASYQLRNTRDARDTLQQTVKPSLKSIIQFIGLVVTVIVASAIASYHYAGWRAAQRLALAIPPLALTEPLPTPTLLIQVRGLAVAQPSAFPHRSGKPQIGWRFTADVMRYCKDTNCQIADAQAAQYPQSLLVTWYRPDNPSYEPLAGQCWQITAKLKPPHGTLNPHSFDREAWLFAQNIRATATVNETGVLRSTEDCTSTKTDTFSIMPLVNNLTDALQRWRSSLRHQMQAMQLPSDELGLLAGLALGDQHAISDEWWRIFRQTGITHLVSVSGVHVTLVASLLAWVLRYVWCSRWGVQYGLPHYLPAPRLQWWVAAIGGTLYAVFTGLSLPALRTMGMLWLVLLIREWGKIITPLRILSWVAILMILADPWAMLSPGFWLSFAAVGLLIINGGDAITHRLAAPVREQLIMTLGLAPLCILFFHELSLLSVLVNLVMIPLMGSVLTPLAVISVLLMAYGWTLPLQITAQCAHLLLQSLAWLVNTLEYSPLADWLIVQVPMLSVWQWFSLIGLTAIIVIQLINMQLINSSPSFALKPRTESRQTMLTSGITYLVLSLVLSIILVFGGADLRPASNTLRVTFFDVGQGMSVLIESRHHAWLYDTGAGNSTSMSSGQDAGGRIILPHLQAIGRSQLDQLILSHHDNDHTGGAISVLNGIKVKQLLTSFPMDVSMRASRDVATNLPITHPPHTLCYAGQQWQVRDEALTLDFRILSPQLAALTDPHIPDNHKSCVIQLTVRDVRHAAQPWTLLLTGDAEAPQEQVMLNNDVQSLKADVLLVPHHGSKTSSTAAWVQAVRPTYAVMQVGYRNHYRHPHPDVVARYHAIGTQILRTDTQGMISMQWAGQGDQQGDAPLQLHTQREQQRRYWHDMLFTKPTD